ncbi:hypothetical protein HanPSC8_Chr11g0459451 [Helianthus annuus]|nr:hypothetical protein HanPSC8_Chr11g0459451 [Helianthus annuus]
MVGFWVDFGRKEDRFLSIDMLHTYQRLSLKYPPSFPTPLPDIAAIPEQKCISHVIFSHV